VVDGDSGVPVSIWTQNRRLTGEERLWLAVLDQACADYGSPNAGVRAAARDWWATGMPAELAAWLEIPFARLLLIRAARGGIRCAADGGGNGRHFGIRCGARPANQYQYRAVRMR
jgi:hypothetical protein